MIYRRLFAIIGCVGIAFGASGAFGATFVVTNASDSGAGSLRQAVFDANDTPGPDVIQFNILPAGPRTILLIADGLAITDPVTIDGSTQPGFAGRPLITLAGDEDANPGLRISTSNCLIRALVIANFAGHGIVLEGDAHDNVIGGTNTGAGNTIVSNLQSGVIVAGGTNNALRGNSIFGNGTLGIDLGNDGLTPNDSLDPDPGPNRLQNFPMLSAVTISTNSLALSGSLNSRASIVFQLDFFASQICDDSGNGEGAQYLGSRAVTNTAGGTINFNVTLPVTASGRYLTATATDPTGNTSEFSPCLRAGSTLAALTFLVTNASDSGPGSLRQAILDSNSRPANGPNAINFNLPDSPPDTIAPVSPLPPVLESAVIDGYTQPGASANTLSHGFNANLLIRLEGTNAGPGAFGLVFQGDHCVVRGLVIAEFEGGGMAISGARSNLIQGNLIGLDVDSFPLGNGITFDDLAVGPGVLVVDASGCTIGGTNAAARNVISANGTDGIQMSGPASSGNRVIGNFVGTDTTGMIGLGNGDWGVHFENVVGNIVGGTNAGAGNLISWNGAGILISAGTSNQIQGNFIGSDVTGTNALGNGSGIFISDSPSLTVGGTNAAARNVIVGNGRGGVEAFGAGVSNNLIQGNFIGTDVTGQIPLGNGSFGVRLEEAQANTLGGVGAGAGNTIAFNLGNGVEIANGARNAISRNSIFSNVGLGIDLDADGVTANDTGDSDAGANELQNTPTLASALIVSNRTIIQGVLDSRAGGTYRLQFFDSPSCDDSGFGEGQTYLTNVTVTTDAGGHAGFSATNLAPLTTGHYVTATATDANNNTSEFSACVRLAPFDSVDLAITEVDSADPVGLSSNFTYTITVSNFGPTNATGVIVTDPLPASLSFISAAPSQGTCSNSAGLITCRLNSLNKNASATILLTVHGTHGGSIANLVTVTADQADNKPENNSALESTLLGVADLKLTLSGTPNPAQAGALLTYSLLVTNLGPDPAAEVFVADLLPMDLVYVSATASPGACSWDGMVVTCQLGDVNLNTARTITIVVKPSVLEFVSNTASVAAGTSDPDSANDSATVTNEIIPLAPVSLTIQTVGNAVSIGWPAETAPGFVLESTLSLAPPVIWTVISNASNPFIITNLLTNGARFYQMRLP